MLRGTIGVQGHANVDPFSTNSVEASEINIQTTTYCWGFFFIPDTPCGMHWVYEGDISTIYVNKNKTNASSIYCWCNLHKPIFCAVILTLTSRGYLYVIPN